MSASLADRQDRDGVHGDQATSRLAPRPMVELQDVSLRYGDDDDTFAVEHLSLSVASGEFVAVVGPSGCGKSTLMKLATGLRLPTRGEVHANGTRVRAPVPKVGMAFQNALMLPWRTVLGNLMLPMEVADQHRHTFKRERKNHEAAALHLLRTVGLGHAVHKFPWQLSGGMQQRLSLCRALIHQPDLLMLDEPFGALDAFTREELWGVLQEIWLDRRFTCILVTHDLHEAAYLADRVVVMSRRPGRVIQDYRVDIARPRRLDDATQAALIPITRQLRDDIRMQMPTNDENGDAR